MNQLLRSINVDQEDLKNIETTIHFIAVDSDQFFPAFEMGNCFEFLHKTNANTYYHEIKSIHGHDAFLMEYDQLNYLLKSVFNEK